MCAATPSVHPRTRPLGAALRMRLLGPDAHIPPVSLGGMRPHGTDAERGPHMHGAGERMFPTSAGDAHPEDAHPQRADATRRPRPRPRRIFPDADARLRPASGPSPARASAQASKSGPVRPATSTPQPVPEGAFRVLPAIGARHERAGRAAPCFPLAPLRVSVADESGTGDPSGEVAGRVCSARESRGMRAAGWLLAALATLVLVAFILIGQLAPAAANANAPYSPAREAVQSTPASTWKQGQVPALYQEDPAWAGVPYGNSTLGGAGGAPVALALAYVAATGDRSLTPADFARWAVEHDLTATDADSIAHLLAEGSSAFGLALEPIGTGERDLRRALVGGIPVLVVTLPGTFAPTASAIVLDDIDQNSRLVVHDPASEHSSKTSRSFEDIDRAAAVAFAVKAA